MSFHWVAETPDGPTPSQDFPTQSDAEAWMTECYLDLVDEGAVAVTLYEGDRLVYGPMSLDE